MKQVAVFIYKDKIVYACEIRDVDSVKYLELKQVAEDNLKDYITRYEELVEKVEVLKEEIEELKHEIKLLKGEE